MYDTLVKFLGWLNEQPDDRKFYHGDLCTTCLVGQYARDVYGRKDLAFDGSHIIQVDKRGFYVDGGVEYDVDLGLKELVKKFDRHLKVFGEKGFLDTFVPRQDVTAGTVKDFIERG